MLTYINIKIKKIVQMSKDYITPNMNIGKMLLILFDYLFAYIIHGAYISDYFQFQFYKKRFIERKQFVTNRKHNKIRNICNQNSATEIFDTKTIFNQTFSQYISRDWIDLATCSFSDFYHFINTHPCFFIKPVNGRYGKGVMKINASEIGDPKSFYENYKQQKMFIEEAIEQHTLLAQLNPSSVNTLRIYTINCLGNSGPKIVAATLRIGNENKATDNFSDNGMGALIDLESGIIKSKAIDQHNQTYQIHPVSGKQIIGFSIPFWNEIKSLACRAAELVPDIRYVGWDIAIGNNTLYLVEGNSGATLFIPQAAAQKGLWPDFKKALNNVTQ